MRKGVWIFSLSSNALILLVIKRSTGEFFSDTGVYSGQTHPFRPCLCPFGQAYPSSQTRPLKPGKLKTWRKLRILGRMALSARFLERSSEKVEAWTSRQHSWDRRGPDQQVTVICPDRQVTVICGASNAARWNTIGLVVSDRRSMTGTLTAG